MHVPKYLSAESSLVLTSPCPQTPLSESVALTGVKNVKFLKGVILDSIPLHSRELHAGREKGPSSLWPLPGSHHRKVHSGGKRTGESPQREGSDGTEQNIPKGNRLRLGDPVLPKKKTRTSRTVPRLLRPRPVLTERHLAQDPAEQLGVMEGRRGGGNLEGRRYHTERSVLYKAPGPNQNWDTRPTRLHRESDSTRIGFFVKRRGQVEYRLRRDRAVGGVGWGNPKSDAVTRPGSVHSCEPLAEAGGLWASFQKDPLRGPGVASELPRGAQMRWRGGFGSRGDRGRDSAARPDLRAGLRNVPQSPGR